MKVDLRDLLTIVFKLSAIFTVYMCAIADSIVTQIQTNVSKWQFRLNLMFSFEVYMYTIGR